MTWKANEDFLGYKKGQVISDDLIEQYPNWKTHCIEDKVDNPLDLNKDGKVDKADVKIAATALAKGRWRKKRK